MTVEKNRYKPLEKIAGLEDKQLTTPKHDEMVIWLLNETNLKKILYDEFYELEHDTSIEIKDKKIISEAPITAQNGFIIGYWDLKILVRYISENSLRSKYKGFYIEVKPKIESFGATLRQLRTYERYIYPDYQGDIYLFTGDPQFKDAFESQGINVILASEVMD